MRRCTSAEGCCLRMSCLHRHRPSSAQRFIRSCRHGDPWKPARFRAGLCLSPYPPHYRAAFTFSTFLYPQRQQLALRRTCRHRQRYGLTRFRIDFRMGWTPRFRRRHYIHEGLSVRAPACPHTFMVHACQHLWPGYYADVYMRFTCVGRTHSSQALLHLDAGRFGLASPDVVGGRPESRQQDVFLQ